MAAPTTPDKKRKVINSEGREIIAKVYHFLRDEYKFMKDNNFDKCDLSPLSNVRKRTAEATGVSESTVTAILREERQLHLTGGKFVPPMSKRRKRDSKHHLDPTLVRTVIRNYHNENKQMPTLIKLSAILKDNYNFTGCLNTLRTFLMKMGYTWEKTGKHRKILHERIKPEKKVASQPKPTNDKSHGVSLIVDAQLKEENKTS